MIPDPLNERSWDNDHDVRQYEGVGTNWNVYAATDRSSAFFVGDNTIAPRLGNEIGDNNFVSHFAFW